MAERQHAVVDLIDGAIAGAVATWVMGRTTTWLYGREGKAARSREEEARGGASAYERAAEKAADAVGAELSDDQASAMGSRIHWGLGIAAGAAYGVMRPRVEHADLARGLAFGTAFWLAADEGAVPALGLTPGPTAFPWQTHARGLAGHLVFGAVADATLAVLQRGPADSDQTALVPLDQTPAAVAHAL